MLETCQSNDWRDFPSAKLSIPTAEGSLAAELEKLNFPRGLLNKGVALGTFSQAVTVTILFLESFNSRIITQSTAQGREFILRQNLPWVLNGYNRLRKVVVRWLQKTKSTLTPDEEQITLSFLTSTRCLCFPQSSQPASLSDMGLISIWIQCLSDLISPSIVCQSSALQISLSRFLDELTGALSWSFVKSLRENFIPILSELNEQDIDVQSINTHLWVNLT